jgi:transketolase
LAARALDSDGIGSIVLHNASVKPLDEAAIIDVARRAGRVITIEEHQAAGGFGSAVAELLAENHSVPLYRIGVRDQFGQSGTPEELLAHYKLGAPAIADRVRKMVGT